MASQGKDVKSWVNEKIQGKKVMVFSKSYCASCRKAKEVLQRYVGKEISEDEYEVFEIANDPDCASIQDYLQQLTGAGSVPRVFIDGKCIGGGDETAALEREGKLRALLST